MDAISTYIHYYIQHTSHNIDYFNTIIIATEIGAEADSLPLLFSKWNLQFKCQPCLSYHVCQLLLICSDIDERAFFKRK